MSRSSFSSSTKRSSPSKSGGSTKKGGKLGGKPDYRNRKRSSKQRNKQDVLSGPIRPMLLIAHPDTGEILEHPHLEMALDNGLDVVCPGKKDLKPVPEGWDIMALPGTEPIGFDPDTGEFVTLGAFTYLDKDHQMATITPLAVACHPPPGYVRTHHPAAHWIDVTHPDEKFKKFGGGQLSVFQDVPEVDKEADAAEQKKNPASNPKNTSSGGDDARPGLPLWAYTAVGYGKHGMVASFFQADETSRWSPDLFYKEELEDKIAARVDEDKENPVLNQIAQCAKNYLCCCAQNIFYERWEGAVPIAPACTAACLGCISKDPEWDTPTPQKRLKFSPKAEDISRVMIRHLKVAPEPMMSFGQGCEGEPTMYGEALVGSVRLTRAETKRGIININTNGSRPQVIRDAAKEGAQALRISINTFDEEVYTAYYRPGDYTLATVMESLYAGRDAGMHVSINFLIWPGWTDRLAELEKVSELVEDGVIQMIQLRNLCVDPGHFKSILPPREKRGMLLGMKGFVDELHRRHPKLRFGTFNPRLAAEWYEETDALYGQG
ncbi:MAG: radical SAM protein [Deltaproteobacteria bacterium]|nr:radical SAM protein [Deltaproteobacteria bacterium]